MVSVLCECRAEMHFCTKANQLKKKEKHDDRVKQTFNMIFIACTVLFK